jgi:hypothetical protein
MILSKHHSSIHTLNPYDRLMYYMVITHAPKFVYPKEHQQVGKLWARLGHTLDHWCHHHLHCRRHLRHPYILHESSPLCQSLPFGLYGFVILGMRELALVHVRLACNSTCEPSVDMMSTPSATMFMSNEKWLHIVLGIVEIHRHRGITLANSSMYELSTPAARPR